MARRTLVFTVAVEFDPAAEYLSAMPAAEGDAVAAALLGLVSVGLTADDVLDGSYARLITHSHLVLSPQTESSE